MSNLKNCGDLLWYFNTSNSWINIDMAIGMLYPVNSLLVSRYQWLISLCKIWFFLIKQCQKISKILNLCAFFLYLQCLLNYLQQFCNFSQNKSRKTYLRQMLLPGGRNSLLIYTQIYSDIAL